MNEKAAAQMYQFLMDTYAKLENDRRAVPTLTLEEQMNITDVTNNAGKYSPENLEKVNLINKKMMKIQQDASKLQYGGTNMGR